MPKGRRLKAATTTKSYANPEPAGRFLSVADLH